MQKYQDKYLRPNFIGNKSKSFKGYGEIGASYFKSLQISANTRKKESGV